jgi:hypothetical protein
MRYLCLIYLDEKLMDALPKAESDSLRREAVSYADAMKENGTAVACHALQRVQSATSMRRRNGKLLVTDGPFAETKEQLGGFMLIETASLSDAIRIASKIPLARYGSIEVRPTWELAQKEPAAGRGLPAQAIGG